MHKVRRESDDVKNSICMTGIGRRIDIFSEVELNLPAVSWGKPVWWEDCRKFGENWIPPGGDSNYIKFEFPFNLRPDIDEEITGVEIIIKVEDMDGNDSPIFLDIEPKLSSENTKSGSSEAEIVLDPSAIGFGTLVIG